MNRITGRRITDDAEHIRQSIHDILTTPVDSRLMRRDYGSLIPYLIDHPATPANLLRLQAAALMAILRWEPRVTAPAGTVVITISGSADVDLDLTRANGPRIGTPLSINNLGLR